MGRTAHSSDPGKYFRRVKPRFGSRFSTIFHARAVPKRSNDANFSKGVADQGLGDYSGSSLKLSTQFEAVKVVKLPTTSRGLATL